MQVCIVVASYTIEIIIAIYLTGWTYLVLFMPTDGMLAMYVCLNYVLSLLILGCMVNA